MNTTTNAAPIVTVTTGRVYVRATPAAKAARDKIVAEFGGPDERRWNGSTFIPIRLVACELRPVNGGVQVHLDWQDVSR